MGLQMSPVGFDVRLPLLLQFGRVFSLFDGQSHRVGAAQQVKVTGQEFEIAGV